MNLFLVVSVAAAAVVRLGDVQDPPAYQRWLQDVTDAAVYINSTARAAQDLADFRAIYEPDTAMLYMASADAVAVLDGDTPAAGYTRMSFAGARHSVSSTFSADGPVLDNTHASQTNSLSLGYSVSVGAKLAYTYGLRFLMAFTFATEHDLEVGLSRSSSITCDVLAGDSVQVRFETRVETLEIEVCGVDLESDWLGYKSERLGDCSTVQLETGFSERATCVTGKTI